MDFTDGADTEFNKPRALAVGFIQIESVQIRDGKLPLVLSSPTRFLFSCRMNLPLGLRVAAACVAVAGSASVAFAQNYWVYFGTYTGARSQGIYVSRLDATGRLTAPELVATTPSPSYLAVDRSHRHLYAANEIKNYQGGSAGSVSAFALDARTGRLAALNVQSTLAPGSSHLVVDATDRTVLVANYAGSSVVSYPVQADGSLGAPVSFIKQQGSSIHERQKAPHAHCVLTDPANRFALMCDLGLDQVLVFKLDPTTAALTPNDPPFARVKAGAGPRHFAFRPDGRFVYVINELDCTMTAFAYDAAPGTLSEIQALSTLPPGTELKKDYACAEVFVHPNGKFLYGSNRGHNSIVVFAIDEATGRLTLVEHVPSGGQKPRGFGLDPAGRFLLSANQDTNNVVVLRIDEKNGRLTPTGSSVEIDKPVCVVFVPVP